MYKISVFSLPLNMRLIQRMADSVLVLTAAISFFTFQENHEGEGDNSQMCLTPNPSDTRHRFTHANKGQLSKSFVSTHMLVCSKISC